MLKLQGIPCGPAGVLLSCCDLLTLRMPSGGYQVGFSTLSSVPLTVISFDSVKLKLIL